MYLTSVTGMFITFAAWTGASASFANTQDSGAAAAVVAMIFLYCESQLQMQHLAEYRS